MDLSWCIICDNRIDDRATESSLYCSESCQGKDESYSSVTGCHESDATHLEPLKNRFNKGGPLPSTSSRLKRGPITTLYPWEFLYTRPRTKRHIMIKRCQPTSSPTTATVFFNPKPSLV